MIESKITFVVPTGKKHPPKKAKIQVGKPRKLRIASSLAVEKPRIYPRVVQKKTNMIFNTTISKSVTGVLKFNIIPPKIIKEVVISVRETAELRIFAIINVFISIGDESILSDTFSRLSSFALYRAVVIESEVQKGINTM